MLPQLLVVASLAAYLWDVALWPLPVFSALLILFALRTRGFVFALSFTIPVIWAALLAAAIIANATGVPLAVALGGALALMASIASTVAFRRANEALSQHRPRRHIPPWSGVALGPIVWATGVATATIRLGHLPLSWAMGGDASNNVVFARQVVVANGIRAVGDPNWIPLPHVLISLFMAPGRAGAAPGPLLLHDLDAFTLTWAFLVAVTCITAGALTFGVARVVAATRPRVLVAASAGGSLLPLTWFFSGYPIAFGFVNAHVALALVLAAFGAYLGAGRTPGMATGALSLNATLMLATWSPLVVVPGGLLVAVILRRHRDLRRSRGVEKALIISALGVLVLYFGAVELPIVMGSTGLLGSGGGFLGFPRWGMPLLGFTAVAVSLIVRSRSGAKLTIGVVTTVCCLAAGLGAVLVLGGHGLLAWTYYPHKFAWLGELMLVTLLTGLAPGLIPVRVRERSAVVLYAGLLVAVFVGLGGAVRSPLAVLAKSNLGSSPVAFIALHGDGGNRDALPQAIADLTRPDELRLLWRSGEAVENDADFWTLNLRAGAIADEMTPEDNYTLRLLGYFPDHTGAEGLCTARTLGGIPVLAVTRDTSLSEEVHNQCPDLDGIRVEVLASLP